MASQISKLFSLKLILVIDGWGIGSEIDQISCHWSLLMITDDKSTKVPGIISLRSEMGLKSSYLSHLPHVIDCFGKLALKASSQCLSQQKAGPIFLCFLKCMMTSSNGNIFRVTGPCAGNSPVTGEFPAQRQWRGTLMLSLICAWING